MPLWRQEYLLALIAATFNGAPDSSASIAHYFGDSMVQRSRRTVQSVAPWAPDSSRAIDATNAFLCYDASRHQIRDRVARHEIAAPQSSKRRYAAIRFGG